VDEAKDRARRERGVVVCQWDVRPGQLSYEAELWVQIKGVRRTESADARHHDFGRSYRAFICDAHLPRIEGGHKPDWSFEASVDGSVQACRDLVRYLTGITLPEMIVCGSHGRGTHELREHRGGRCCECEAAERRRAEADRAKLRAAEAETLRLLSDFRDAGSFVYYIGCRSWVKIGKAKKPAQRLRELQTGCPLPIDVLAVEPGGRRVEAMRHREFGALRLHGEWFKHTAGLASHVHERRATYALALSEAKGGRSL